MLTSKPTARLEIRSGPARRSVVSKLRRASWTTNSGVIETSEGAREKATGNGADSLGLALLFYPKLFTNDPITRPHPSTSTNSKILKGSEIMTGGSIIIPIDINTEATTMSTTMKGM